MPDISVPSRLSNTVGNFPDADKMMSDYDFLTAALLGSFVQDGGFENIGASFANPADATALETGIWTYNKSGAPAASADVTKDTVVFDTGVSSLKINITGAGSAASLITVKQNAVSAGILAGFNVAFGMRAKVGTSNKVRVRVTDGTTTVYSTYHSGDGTWQTLTAKLPVISTATTITVYLEILSDWTGAVNADGAFLYIVPSAISTTSLASLFYSPALELILTTFAQSLVPSSDNAIDVGSSVKNWRNLYLAGTLYLRSSGGANTIGILAPATLAASLTLALPNTNGASGQTLKTDGAGNLSWGAASVNTGQKNYITNTDAESDATSWNLYNDGAAATPVDGTGGTATGLTFTRTTSSPLRGTGSFSLAKDASNRQGDGVSTDFTIDSADQAKVLGISFDYNASTAMVVGSSSDISVWIYDVTNAALIPVSPYQLQGRGTNNFKFQGVFQTASNSTSYRLIIHIATTNASAWTLVFDNVVVGPQIYLYGAPMTDWTAYTPTLGGTAGTVTSGIYYRRVGDTLVVQGWYNATTWAATNLSISLPAGLTIDTTKIGSSTNRQNVGAVMWHTTDASPNFDLETFFDGSDTSNVYLGNSAQATQTNAKRTGSSFFATTATTVFVSFQVPITGWSSTVLMSNDTDTRVCAARYKNTAAQTLTTGVSTVIGFDTKDYDTHGAVSGSTTAWIFTCPLAGYYRVKAALIFAANTTGQRDLFLRKNGSDAQQMASTAGLGTLSASLTPQVTGDTVVLCNAGDTLAVTGTQNSGGNLNVGGSANYTWIEIQRLTGPSAIAAVENVACQYTNAAGTAFSANVTTTIPFATKTYDSHGSFVTDTFTAPIAGKYDVKVILLTGGITWSNGDQIVTDILKNGSIHTEGYETTGAWVGFSIHIRLATVVSCLAGDTIKIQINSPRAGSLNAISTRNILSITRLAN